MPTATFDTSQSELLRLESFAHNLAEHKRLSYVEAQLRDDFLNPFFAALGWDIANTARLVQKHREFEIESRTQIAGRQKRADYLLRIGGAREFCLNSKTLYLLQRRFSAPALQLATRMVSSYERIQTAWSGE
jgi:hypothetical protein